MTALAQARSQPRWARWRRWHPEWWIYVVAAGSWVVLVLVSTGAGQTGSSQSATPGLPLDLGHELASASLMVTAMMAPMVAPMARFVALASLRQRRYWGPAVFMVAYLSVWASVGLAFGIAKLGIVAVVGMDLGLALIAVAAVGWQLTAAKRRALQRCDRTMPLAARGRRADHDCLRFGVVVAKDCIATCGGLMALATASHHAVPVVGVLFMLQVHERTSQHYDPRLGAVAIAALGSVLTLLALGTPA